MRNISKAVQEIVEQDLEVAHLLSSGLLNRSEYARKIQKQVEVLSMKEVSIKSIVVSLSRLKIEGVPVPDYVEVEQLSIHTPIVDIIYDKNKKNLEILGSLAGEITIKSEGFLTFSTSTREISITASHEFESLIIDKFLNTEKIVRKDLSAVSILFKEELVPIPNIGLYFHRLIATRGIPLDKVVTTNNEFTLIFNSKYLKDMLEVLNRKKDPKNESYI